MAGRSTGLPRTARYAAHALRRLDVRAVETRAVRNSPARRHASRADRARRRSRCHSGSAAGQRCDRQRVASRRAAHSSRAGWRSSVLRRGLVVDRASRQEPAGGHTAPAFSPHPSRGADAEWRSAVPRDGFESHARRRRPLSRSGRAVDRTARCGERAAHGSSRALCAGSLGEG